MFNKFFSIGNDHVEMHRAFFGSILQLARNLKPFPVFKWKSRGHYRLVVSAVCRLKTFASVHHEPTQFWIMAVIRSRSRGHVRGPSRTLHWRGSRDLNSASLYKTTIYSIRLEGRQDGLHRLEYCKFISSHWTTDNWAVSWLLIFWRITLQETTKRCHVVL